LRSHQHRRRMSFRGSFRPIKFIDKHITPEEKELKY
jgi:hypothetical protein